MSEEQLKRVVRTTRRKRTLGPDARCAQCGCADLSALVRRKHGQKYRILCYECAQGQDGKRTTERHHVVGHVNDKQATVEVPGNMHRALSDRQYDWPDEVRHNLQRDPLLWLAGLLYSIRDYLHYLVEIAGHIADWLVEAACTFRTKFGDTWWTELGLSWL